MRFSIFAIALIAVATAENWAVLVAGSDGFWNYRHQSDVSHAYQILKKGGIKPEHIITMMYNDVADDEENPFPHQLYNRPGDDTPDVYDGVVVDYEKDDVTPENFMKVLLGDESTGKKVLKSTSEDNVFFFFSDHGGPDVLCFPAGDLQRKDFIATLEKMHEKGMYKKFVLYIEACYSGSMAKGLPEDIGVSIVTAANDRESSWGWYCGDEAVVKGKEIGSCLGDEFSVRWMEDADRGEQKTETLEEQFNLLVKQVTKSHVSRYGDTSFANDVIGEFIGYPTTKTFSIDNSRSSWDSRDAKVFYLLYKYQSTTGEQQKKFKKLYEEEIELRKQIDDYISKIAPNTSVFSSVVDPVKDTKCYEAGIAQMEAMFGRNDYQFKYYNVIANMCNANGDAFSKK